MRKLFIKALRLFIMLTILTGLIYPLTVTLLANLLFPKTSGGSLVIADGTVVGSALLAQRTTAPLYVWPRPSATDYSTLPSGASNLGPSSKILRDQLAERRRDWKSINGAGNDIPAEMLTASGSGLDPHVSPESAEIQLNRVAKFRKWDLKKMESAKQALHRSTETPLWGFIGQPRVNILLLNLALNKI